MKIENLHTDYKTTASYEKMYDGYYQAICNHCGRIIATSSKCQIGNKGKKEALTKATAVEHSCPEKPPLVER